MAFSNSTLRRTSVQAAVSVQVLAAATPLPFRTFLCVTLPTQHVNLVQDQHHWSTVKRCSQIIQLSKFLYLQ